MIAVDSPVWGLLEAFPHRTVLAEGSTRRVVRYAAAPDAGDAAGPVVIAKFYQNDVGARTAHAMDALSAALDRSPSPALCIPRLLGYDRERKMLLQEPAPGVRLDALLEGPDVRKALYAVGAALSALHGLDAAVGPARRLRGHVGDLIRPHPRRLAQELPGLSPRLDRIFAALFTAEARFLPGREVAIHRDVHPRQMFLDGRRMCLIDWDLCARGDAALDVGNFVAWLRARLQMEDEAIDCVLHGYAASGRIEVLERAPLYEAFTYVRLACKRFRLARAGWREECEALITRAERCLESRS